MFKVLLLVKSIYAEEGSIKILMNVPIIVAVEARTTNVLYSNSTNFQKLALWIRPDSQRSALILGFKRKQPEDLSKREKGKRNKIQRNIPILPQHTTVMYRVAPDTELAGYPTIFCRYTVSGGISGWIVNIVLECGRIFGWIVNIVLTQFEINFYLLLII